MRLTKPLVVGLGLGLLVAGPPLRAQQSATQSPDRMVEIGGHAMRVRALNLAQRRPGMPVVVFEAGATNGLEVWGDILERVDAPVVAYDRAGLGRSEWDSVMPTPRHVSDRLRKLLRAGIVYVDPAPLVTMTMAERDAPYDSVGAGRDGYDAAWGGTRPPAGSRRAHGGTDRGQVPAAAAPGAV